MRFQSIVKIITQAIQGGPIYPTCRLIGQVIRVTTQHAWSHVEDLRTRTVGIWGCLLGNGIEMEMDQVGRTY